MRVNMSVKPREIFTALSDETRFKIVSCLLEGERCACVIPKLVGRAQPTVSLQLKKLVKLGVLEARRDGKKVMYRVRDSRVTRVLEAAGFKPRAKGTARIAKKVSRMDEKIAVRLFYAPKCSGGCCGCAPDPNVAVFEEVAEKLVKKLGEGRLSFEAYNSMDLKRFPFLRDARQPPVVAVNERVVSEGKTPEFSDVERELKRLKAF